MRRESHSMGDPMTKSYEFIEQYDYPFIRRRATLFGAVGVCEITIRETVVGPPLEEHFTHEDRFIGRLFLSGFRPSSAH